MIGGGSYDRETGCVISSAAEREGFKGDESLIVIHSQCSIILLIEAAAEIPVCRKGPFSLNPLFTRLLNGRFNDLDLFPPQHTTVPCVGVQPEDADHRLQDVEIVSQ